MGRYNNEKLTLDQWMENINALSMDAGYGHQVHESWAEHYDNGLTADEAWEEFGEQD